MEALNTEGVSQAKHLSIFTQFTGFIITSKSILNTDKVFGGMCLTAMYVVNTSINAPHLYPGLGLPIYKGWIFVSIYREILICIMLNITYYQHVLEIYIDPLYVLLLYNEFFLHNSVYIFYRLSSVCIQYIYSICICDNIACDNSYIVSR